MASYVVKAEIKDVRARTFSFPRIKTMYGGRRIKAGEEVFLFASETESGQGLIALGVVAEAKPTPLKPGMERRTPRVSIEVKRLALAKRRLGRDELKIFRDSKEKRPETELDFKFYRQATNKIGGISEETATWLRRFF
jgi:hypothetical protein